MCVGGVVERDLGGGHGKGCFACPQSQGVLREGQLPPVPSLFLKVTFVFNHFGLFHFIYFGNIT